MSPSLSPAAGSWPRPCFDAHVHLVRPDQRRLEELAMALEADGMNWLTICWYQTEESLHDQREAAREASAKNREVFPWVSTFSLKGFGEPGWQRRALSEIEDAATAGAVGVKVWKTIGMELKDAEGRFVLIDDDRFDPLFETMERRGLTLVAHIGEPRNCWLPPEEMTVSTDRTYFRDHPEYHALLHPEMLGYRELLASRDRMLDKHPGLRVVGCHLGSLEFDVVELAACLQRHPNLAVDLSARTCHLQAQGRSAVRDVLVAHQDRFLYGTDSLWPVDEEPAGAIIARLRDRYQRDWDYFAGSGVVDAPDVAPGYRCEALGLPGPALDRIYRDNVAAWYPLAARR
jgi:predicted TIM-barrel fold metal-dependent hydrolase